MTFRIPFVSRCLIFNYFVFIFRTQFHTDQSFIRQFITFFFLVQDLYAEDWLKICIRFTWFWILYFSFQLFFFLSFLLWASSYNIKFSFKGELSEYSAQLRNQQRISCGAIVCDFDACACVVYMCVCLLVHITLPLKGVGNVRFPPSHIFCFRQSSHRTSIYYLIIYI